MHATRVDGGWGDFRRRAAKIIDKKPPNGPAGNHNRGPPPAYNPDLGPPPAYNPHARPTDITDIMPHLLTDREMNRLLDQVAPDKRDDVLFNIAVAQFKTWNAISNKGIAAAQLKQWNAIPTNTGPNPLMLSQYKFYAVLGLTIERGKSIDENGVHLYNTALITKLCKTNSLLTHPDKGPGFEDIFRVIRAAKETLLDDEKRRKYDQYGDTDELRHEFETQFKDDYSASYKSALFV